MSDSLKHVNATIHDVSETPGAFFYVRLVWLPREGDLIEHFSFQDADDNQAQDQHHWEVVKVVHVLNDISNKAPDSIGRHTVQVLVKPSKSNYFQ